ncbi:hypothetical protein U0070_016920 [Myodes glareolus]|uniref:Uncharacterized protein n=1 Tax=Myodes glareolus TaxID=447135 RepID=A0AAW0I1N6_MYOGA
MGGLPVQSKKYLKIYLLPAHRSEGPWPLNPPQTSIHPGNKNGEPETRGTREEDAAPGGAQQSDACLGSRDTDEAEDEQLFRSVEGQAASEDEEERWREQSRPPQAHAEVSVVQPSGCVSWCDEQTTEKLKTPFGRCDGADHVCNLELETHVTRLGEQLQTLGCNGKTLGTPEEVSMTLRSQVLQLEGLAAIAHSQSCEQDTGDAVSSRFALWELLMAS